MGSPAAALQLPVHTVAALIPCAIGPGANLSFGGLVAQLPIEELALEFARRVDAVAEALPPHRGYLAVQMRRAASSVYLNLREGLGEYSPREKARFYRMSVRSLRESDGCLILSKTLHPKLDPLVATAARTGNVLAPQIVRLIIHQERR